MYMSSATLTTFEERDDTHQCVPDLPNLHSNYALLVYVMSTPHGYRTMINATMANHEWLQ